MRKVVFTLSLLMIALIGFDSFAQEVVQQKSGAVIQIDKDVHDYGTLTQGEDAQCTFIITNKGNEPLILSKCKPSCGCTIPSCPQEPIAPGKSTTITVKYDSNRVGPINKSVTISSNATNEPAKVIRIKGNIKAKPSTDAPSK